MTLRWEDVRRIAEEALSLAGDARSRFVTESCGQDAELRAEVEALLAEDETADRFLDRDPRQAVQGVERMLALPEGTRLGPWEVRRAIASGGMGIVYEGSRADRQFEKRVAIKVVKPGMDSAEILGRFENERQVLADLEHPSIARLLDGGVTPEGRPFLVMEYVDGAPIDRFCAARGLSVEARLRLFIEVCGAVQAAHQALIVHRDLKPSNVLVTEDGQPKLLDFGIAKVLDAAGGDGNLATLGPSRAMTPEYASPEQVKGGRITTATDVYALGLLLFEILTGTRPFDYGDSTWASIERTVLEQEPPLPSTVADRAVAKLLRGDLDNVVRKALQKDSARRYPSVQQFADDIGRHLDGLPVTARPDTVSYRAWKFARRNRTPVSAAVVAVLALVAGLITTLVQYRRAVDAGDLAERRFSEARGLGHAILHELDQWLQPLEGATPAREFVVRTGLDYLDRLAADAEDDRGLLLEVTEGYLRVGDVQGGVLTSNLGRRDEAKASYEKALAIAKRLVKDAPEDARGRRLLAFCHHRLGSLREASGSLEEALDYYRTAVELCQEAEEGPDRELLYSALWQVQDRLVTHALQTGRHDEALAHAEEHVRIADELAIGEEYSDPSVVPAALARRGRVLTLLGRHDDAEIDLRDALELARAASEAHPRDRRLARTLSFTLTMLAQCLQLERKYEECLELLRENVDLNRRAAAADPENVEAQHLLAVALITLGQTLIPMGRAEEAYEVAVEQVEVAERLVEVDPGNSDSRNGLVAARITLTRALVMLERPEEALEPCLAARREADDVAAAQPADAQAEMSAALVYWDLGKVHRARAKANEAELPRRIELLREARDAFQEGLDRFRVLADQDRLPPTHRGFIATWDEDLRATKSLIGEASAELNTSDIE